MEYSSPEIFLWVYADFYFPNISGRDAVVTMDERGEIRRNLVNPPLKDTVMVPDGGFTVLRFLADNPGYWLVHCHMSWHNHLGMGFVIKVILMDDIT